MRQSGYVAVSTFSEVLKNHNEIPGKFRESSEKRRGKLGSTLAKIPPRRKISIIFSDELFVEIILYQISLIVRRNVLGTIPRDLHA